MPLLPPLSRSPSSVTTASTGTSFTTVPISVSGAYNFPLRTLWDITKLTRHQPRTTIEICTAIVAGSFPCLKPLFKRILDASSARHGSAPYGSKYQHNGYIRNTGTERSRVGRDDEVEMYGRSKHTASIHGGYRSNMDSEESIIPQHGLSVDGITKTTQVSVSVADDEQTQTKKPKDLV